jgi:hypothetical protein
LQSQLEARQGLQVLALMLLLTLLLLLLLLLAPLAAYLSDAQLQQERTSHEQPWSQALGTRSVQRC